MLHLLLILQLLGGDYYVIVANSAGCSTTSGSENIFEIILDAPTSLEVEDVTASSANLIGELLHLQAFTTMLIVLMAVLLGLLFQIIMEVM